MGAPGHAEISAEDTARVNGLVAQINAKLGGDHHYTSFTIQAHATQVVAGTNHFYHVTGEPNGHGHTITIYEPLPHTGLPAEVSEVSEGHNHLHQGHSQPHHH